MKQKLEINKSSKWGQKPATDTLQGIVDNKPIELKSKRDLVLAQTTETADRFSKPFVRWFMSQGEKDVAQEILRQNREVLAVEMQTEIELMKALGETVVIDTVKKFEAVLKMGDSTRIKIADAHINREILSHTSDIRSSTKSFLKEIGEMRKELQEAHEEDKPMIQSLMNRIRDNWFARLEVLTDRISEVIMVELKSVRI